MRRFRRGIRAVLPHCCARWRSAVLVCMSVLAESPTIEASTTDLCEAILASDGFQSARSKIDAFLADESAVDGYRAWQELGQALHMKEHNGESPSAEEVTEYQKLQAVAMENPATADFVEAENLLNGIFSTVTKSVQKTLQTGKVPTEEDLAESGCCGGQGGGGCGCH